MQKKTYDVIVFGGGTAGVIAAIQAGRAGASTLLVEKTGMLGGTITTAGVDFPGLFGAWGHQLIAGIGWELVAKCLTEAGELIPEDKICNVPPEHWKSHVRVDKAFYAALADEMVQQAGCDILFHTMPAFLQRQADKWNVKLCTKQGVSDFSSKVVVDCTGDANAISLAGLEVVRNDKKQPGTLMMHVGGYDFDSLDFDTLEEQFACAAKRGEVSYSDVGNSTKDAILHFLQVHGSNANHIVGIDASTSEGKTQLELAGRASMLRLLRFLRKQPGLEKLKIDYFAPECGVRETVTIKGRTEITKEDYLMGKLYDDALCYSFYPIDIHNPDGHGITQTYLGQGVCPTIPRGAMLPEKGQFIIAAGRIIAGDQAANSAYRVEATCMATGQAAGAMAVLSSKENISPERLEISDIHELLLRYGGVVPKRALI